MQHLQSLCTVPQKQSRFHRRKQGIWRRIRENDRVRRRRRRWSDSFGAGFVGVCECNCSWGKACCGLERQGRGGVMGDAAGTEQEARRGHEGDEAPMPAFVEEETLLKKKYGGLVPKKSPLLSKDHERAFFDSADWALGKQGSPPGQKPRNPIEALRPKLQPTPHQPLPSRKSSYIAPDGEEEAGAAPEHIPN